MSSKSYNILKIRHCFKYKRARKRFKIFVKKDNPRVINSEDLEVFLVKLEFGILESFVRNANLGQDKIKALECSVSNVEALPKNGEEKV